MNRVKDAVFMSFAVLYLLAPAIGAFCILFSISYAVGVAVLGLGSMLSSLAWRF